MISNTIKNLESNNFEVFLAEDLQSAKDIFEHKILSEINVRSASYGDSITMKKSGVINLLKDIQSINFIDTFKPEDSWKDQINKRKDALTVDLFITGTNAITESGQLVNLDMIGNRVAALTFGPKNVVLFVGINKIVKDLNSAFRRIKTIAAPQNAIRHKSLKTPCQKTGECVNCYSSQRICNTWTITEKSYPKNRIKIILINENLGL